MNRLIKLSVLFLVFLVTACNSDTEKKEEPNISVDVQNGKDTSKTKVDIGGDGIKIQTDDGTKIEVGKEGGEIKTKDADIRIKTEKD